MFRTQVCFNFAKISSNSTVSFSHLLLLSPGFTVLRQSVITLSADKASQFYEEHKGKPFYDGLVSFMTSGPITVMVLEKHQAISGWRKLLGPTNTEKVHIVASLPRVTIMYFLRMNRQKLKTLPVSVPNTELMVPRMHAMAPTPLRRQRAKFQYFSLTLLPQPQA